MTELLRNLPTRQLPRVRRGERISARRTNERIDALNRLVTGVTPPQQVVDMQPVMTVGEAEGTTVAAFKIVSSGRDWWNCVKWDFTGEDGDAVQVAKPFSLRRSEFDGKTIDGIVYTYSATVTRTARRTAGGASEVQVVRPKVASTDVIFAVRASTGVSVSVEVPDAPPELRPLAWLDLNIDARAWHWLPPF